MVIYLVVLHVFYISSVVSISLSSLQDPEATSSHRVHIRAAVRQPRSAMNLQHTAVVCKSGEHTETHRVVGSKLKELCERQSDPQHSVAQHSSVKGEESQIHSGFIFIPVFSDCIHHDPPFSMFVAAHAKLPGARLHASSHHEAITRLEDMERTGHARVRHRTHKDRDILS